LPAMRPRRSCDGVDMVEQFLISCQSSVVTQFQ
jgi:hypothetical protein